MGVLQDGGVNRTDPLRSPSSSRRSVGTSLAGLAVVVLVLAALAVHRGWGPLGFDAGADNPFAGRPPFADPGSRAAQAAETARQQGDQDRAEVFARLAEVPQGIWLTPEDDPPGEVGERVGRLVRMAQEAERTPVFVVYGIPDRDCSGGQSAGGLTADAYLPWVEEISRAASAGGRSVVVLEPDAVVSAPDCPGREERLRLLREAASLLADAGVTTYLDGGHSAWRSPEEMAALLREAGVEEVRGFATNVSNYQPDEAERAYAEDLRERLDGAHFVIDRSRNGGDGAGGEWCNLPGWRFGEEPAVVDEGGLDAYLWIKPPGESDGECNGGPPAGAFWGDRVVEAARAG